MDEEAAKLEHEALKKKVEDCFILIDCATLWEENFIRNVRFQVKSKMLSLKQTVIIDDLLPKLTERSEEQGE